MESPLSPLELSVVVITHNRAAMVSSMLRSLLQLEVPPALSWEIVVVCNACADDSAERVRAIAAEAPIPIRVVIEGRRGVAFARNAGVRQSSRRYVAFLDDDVVVDPKYLLEVVKAIRSCPEADLFGGAVDPIFKEPMPRWVAQEGPYLLYGAVVVRHREGVEPRHYERIPLTANMWFRREVFERIGGFDENLQRIGEDVDFGHRALNAGFKFWYWPGALVYHPAYAARARLPFIARWYYWAGWGWGRYRVQVRDERRLLGIPLWLLRVEGEMVAKCLNPKTWGDSRALVFHFAQAVFTFGKVVGSLVHNRSHGESRPSGSSSVGTLPAQETPAPSGSVDPGRSPS